MGSLSYKNLFKKLLKLMLHDVHLVSHSESHTLTCGDPFSVCQPPLQTLYYSKSLRNHIFRRISKHVLIVRPEHFHRN